MLGCVRVEYIKDVIIGLVFLLMVKLIKKECRQQQTKVTVLYDHFKNISFMLSKEFTRDNSSALHFLYIDCHLV